MELVGLALLLGACVGHVAILSFSNNWWFACALPHRFLSGLRNVHGLLVVLGLAGFAGAWVGGFSLVEGLRAGEPGRVAAAVYVLACALVGLGLLPLLTAWRLLRPRPAALLSNHTRTIDVAGQLGYKPAGRGKWRFLARLPGNEVFQVDLAERTLRLARLPAAWDGLTVLHLSDLHLCGSPDRAFFQHVMDLCRAWEPDLVAVTGDIIDSPLHHRWILPVLGRLRWRLAAFAILGNHDAWHEPAAVRRRLGRLGFRVLGNCWQQLDVAGRPLVVIGHEGPWFRPGPDLTGCPPQAFRLCLSHTPDNIRWARQHGIDLMLAGHVHGGQIRLPVLGSILVPSRYGRRYDCGTFAEPPTVLHVSRGLGGQHPLRFNCRPEVTKLVLRAAG